MAEFLELDTPLALAESSRSTPIGDNNIADHDNVEPKTLDKATELLNLTMENVQSGNDELKDLRAQVQALKLENEALKSGDCNTNKKLKEEIETLKLRLDTERVYKDYFQDQHEEILRFWKTAELESSAKDDELARVRERLAMAISRETKLKDEVTLYMDTHADFEIQLSQSTATKLQEEVDTLKETETDLQNQLRMNYPILTMFFAGHIPHIMQNWKLQIQQQIYAKLSDKHSDDEWLKAAIQGREDMIMNIKEGNKKHQKEIEKLKETTPFMADLKIKRLETFIQIRKEFIENLENENDETLMEIKDLSEETEECTVLFRV